MCFLITLEERNDRKSFLFFCFFFFLNLEGFNSRGYFSHMS